MTYVVNYVRQITSRRGSSSPHFAHSRLGQWQLPSGTPPTDAAAIVPVVPSPVQAGSKSVPPPGSSAVQNRCSPSSTLVLADRPGPGTADTPAHLAQVHRLLVWQLDRLLPGRWLRILSPMKGCPLARLLKPVPLNRPSPNLGQCPIHSGYSGKKE